MIFYQTNNRRIGNFFNAVIFVENLTAFRNITYTGNPLAWTNQEETDFAGANVSISIAKNQMYANANSFITLIVYEFILILFKAQ
jgi:hypothetical protein